jgi:hypothetical protein
MRYIIDNMSDIIITDLYNTTYFSLGLCNILIIDKIYELQDKYLIHLLRNILGKDDDPEDVELILVRCYYIIRWLTIDDGKEVMNYINLQYKSKLLKPYIIHDIPLMNKIREHQLLHNELLVSHFIPRGSHTKCACTF